MAVYCLGSTHCLELRECILLWEEYTSSFLRRVQGEAREGICMSESERESLRAQNSRIQRVQENCQAIPFDHLQLIQLRRENSESAVISLRVKD